MSPRPGVAVIGRAHWPGDQLGPLNSPIRSASSCGKASADRPSMVRRSASAVSWSVPGARPMPRSIRPGCSASSVPNCSATTSGAWLGSITPPEPTRIVEVAAARCAISTAGRGTGDGGHVVMLGHPEPPVAQFLGAPGQRRWCTPAPGRRWCRRPPGPGPARRAVRRSHSRATRRPRGFFRRPRATAGRSGRYSGAFLVSQTACRICTPGVMRPIRVTRSGADIDQMPRARGGLHEQLGAGRVPGQRLPAERQRLAVPVREEQLGGVRREGERQRGRVLAPGHQGRDGVDPGESRRTPSPA